MNQNEGFFANISVTWKLNIIIGVMILGLVIIFLTGATGLASNQSTVVASYNHILNSSTAISSINNSLSVIQFNIEPLLNPNISLNDIKIYQNAIDDAMENILTAFEDYESTHLSTNSPELSILLQEQNFQGLQDQELNAFRSFRNSFTQFEIAETQFKYLRDSDVNEGYFANLTTSRLIQTRLDLQLLVEANNRYAEIIDETSVSAYQNTIGTMLLALIIAIFFGWLLSNSISRSISSRLGQLERSASSLEEHTYDVRYALSIGGKDEISRLSNAFDRMFKQLQSTLIGLEERVDERTANLATATKESEKRAGQFEAVTLVGGAISSIRSLEDLLPKITELISQQFGYYHTGIFLSDANNEYAVLNAANSEGGQHMLQRDHKLRIGEQGIVGYAISTGRPRIALDVGEDAVYFDNPDMPDTRSEMALPLKIGEDIVGALDVQSTEASAFSEEDVSVLSLLADQVSMAIENARLFDQARKSLAESEALYRQYLRQAWNRLPKEQNLAGFRYNVRGASPIEVKSKMDSINTRNQGKEESETQNPGLSVPIAIRGETIGTLSVQIPDAKSFNDDQMDLVNAVAERVALSAENARLFEETTRRAERERLVSDITVKIRSTNDPDTMVQTALDELKNALGATKVQLVPHALKKEDMIQGLENPAPPFDAKPTRKRKTK